MSKIDKMIEELKYERRGIGDIIDDRSLHRIPFIPYTEQYKELTEIIEVLEAFKDGRVVIKARLEGYDNVAQ